MSCQPARTTALLAIAVFATTHVGPAQADDVTLGALTIGAPWARASAGMAQAGAAFMTITNQGATDRLVSAAAEVSEVVELHTHIQDGDVMRMRKIDAIEVPGETVTHLRPGGLHIMFIGLDEPLQEGGTFPLSLTFETAGTVEVTVTVQGVAAMGKGSMGHGQGATH